MGRFDSNIKNELSYIGETLLIYYLGQYRGKIQLFENP